MMRKSLICFVILAFLNFVIAPEFDAVHAGTGSGGSGFEGASFGSGGGEHVGSVLAIVAAVAVVTGLVIYGLVKASRNKKEQQVQPPTVDEGKTSFGKSLQKTYEELAAENGQLALMRW